MGLLASNFFLLGILFLFLDILGENVERILPEVRDRPRFIVSERLGVSEAAPRNDFKNLPAGIKVP